MGFKKEPENGSEYEASLCYLIRHDFFSTKNI